MSDRQMTAAPSKRKLNNDPMPKRVEPALALLQPTAPKGDAWIYEIKWDGYRLAVHVEPDKVRILTRGGHDWTDRFPSIADAAGALNRTMILDGEAVVLDEEGRPDFGMLQQALGGRGGKRRSGEAILYVFDLVYLDGRDLTNLSPNVVSFSTPSSVSTKERSVFPNASTPTARSC